MWPRWRRPIGGAGIARRIGVSAAQRAVRQMLRSRRQLVHDAQRHDLVAARAAAAGRAIGSAGGSAPHGAGAARAPGACPTALAATLAPLRADDRDADRPKSPASMRAWRRRATADPVVQRLQSVPGVGPMVALTFRAFVDDVTRFGSAGQVSAAIGLVPREDSSAERRHRGHITKAGPRELRSLLVQAAWACWRSHAQWELRAWVERLAGRRGRRIAVVALARRLSRILFALWRDGRCLTRRPWPRRRGLLGREPDTEDTEEQACFG